MPDPTAPIFLSPQLPLLFLLSFPHRITSLLFSATVSLILWFYVCVTSRDWSWFWLELMSISVMGFSSGDGFDKREAKVQLRPEIQEAGFHGGVGMQRGHGLELDLEFKPIEHPVEPPDEDRPVKCPMPGSSVPNEERFAESLRKRVELSSDMNEEGMLVMAIEPPARAVRKRHHTLTRNHSMPPLFRRTPLPPIPTQNTTIFQMLQQCNEYESCQDIQY